jgi:hypothetical protein
MSSIRLPHHHMTLPHNHLYYHVTLPCQHLYFHVTTQSPATCHLYDFHVSIPYIHVSHMCSARCHPAICQHLYDATYHVLYHLRCHPSMFLHSYGATCHFCIVPCVTSILVQVNAENAKFD